MNERLKVLAEQAGAQFGDHGKGEYVDVSDINVLEKFVELILAECSERASQYIRDCGEVSSLPENILREHFGIK